MKIIKKGSDKKKENNKMEMTHKESGSESDASDMIIDEHNDGFNKIKKKMDHNPGDSSMEALSKMTSNVDNNQNAHEKEIVVMTKEGYKLEKQTA